MSKKRKLHQIKIAVPHSSIRLQIHWMLLCRLYRPLHCNWRRIRLSMRMRLADTSRMFRKENRR